MHHKSLTSGYVQIDASEWAGFVDTHLLTRDELTLVDICNIRGSINKNWAFSYTSHYKTTTMTKMTTEPMVKPMMMMSSPAVVYPRRCVRLPTVGSRRHRSRRNYRQCSHSAVCSRHCSSHTRPCLATTNMTSQTKILYEILIKNKLKVGKLQFITC